MTMNSLRKQHSSLQLNSLQSAPTTWKETSGLIGKPYRNSRQCLQTGRHSKLLFSRTTQMLWILNLPQQTLTNLLRNIPTGTCYPSLSLHHLIDSSDVLSLSEFASFNWQFRRLTYRLLASNCVCWLEVQKAYTQSIHPELCQLIHIYLVTKKVSHISGESYTVEQIQDVAEYIFRGSDPRFESPGQVSNLQNMNQCHQPDSQCLQPDEVIDQTVHQPLVHPLKLPMVQVSTAAPGPAPSHAEVHWPDDHCCQLNDQPVIGHIMPTCSHSIHLCKTKLKVADIQIQPHFWATLHFAYFSLKHNVIGFLLATISSSDLWGGFVAAKKNLTGLNKFL